MLGESYTLTMLPFFRCWPGPVRERGVAHHLSDFLLREPPPLAEAISASSSYTGTPVAGALLDEQIFSTWVVPAKRARRPHPLVVEEP